MEILYDPSAWLAALIIFCLRVADMTLDTIRLLYLVRGRKLLVWVLGATQAVIFVVAIGSALSKMDNPLNIVGFALGFATGNLVGMWIEERLALGFVRLSIISSANGPIVAQTLRKEGFAVTEILARGRDGAVDLLYTGVLRRNVDVVKTIVLEKDPAAFITAEDVRPVRRGYWRS